MKMCFYVCPVCGNIITSVGNGVFSCCAITLPEVEAEKAEEEHGIHIETVDNFYICNEISLPFRVFEQ